MGQTLPQEIARYIGLGLIPIPLKPRSKVLLVKWRNSWNPSPEEPRAWAPQPHVGRAVRRHQNLAVADFEALESSDAFRRGSYDRAAKIVPHKINGEEHREWYKKLWNKRVPWLHHLSVSCSQPTQSGHACSAKPEGLS